MPKDKINNIYKNSSASKGSKDTSTNNNVISLMKARKRKILNKKQVTNDRALQSKPGILNRLLSSIAVFCKKKLAFLKSKN